MFQVDVRRRDNITYWALVLLGAWMTVFIGFISGSTIVTTFWKVALLVGVTALLIRFYIHAVLAYAYIRKHKYLLSQVENYWISGNPTLDELKADIKNYDQKAHVTVTRKHMLWAQLRAGYFLILGIPFGGLVATLLPIGELDSNCLFIIGLFAVYLLYEAFNFLEYGRIKKPKKSPKKPVV